MSNEILRKQGWIEVICGSMFSGKTEELLRRVRRAEIAKQKTILFKPAVDIRYSKNEIVTHSNISSPSIAVSDPAELLQYADRYDVFGIDEAQFFGMVLIEVVERLADQGKRVILAGLDQDYTRQPFGPMPVLLAKAEYVSKVQAICTSCGNPATYSYRKIKSTAQVVLGGVNEYEPRCRACYLDGEGTEEN
jgi:thymidine kinase